MKKVAKTAMLTLAILAITSQAAFAGDNGQGWIGEASDKVVTFFGLGIVILFPLIAAIGTFIQSRLERRADERKSAIFKHR
jgi:membrane protein insertase Oxa1/YidC/SpoIIIJ